MQKVAFFDIDGTVFRGSLLIELVEELIRSGAFPTEVRSRYHESYTAWRDREESYEKYAWDVVLAFEAHIQGLHYGVLKDAGRRVVESQGRQIYRYTRDLIYDLKKKGYSIVAISQSPKLILDEFCRDHGFDKVYGRIYEIGPRVLFIAFLSISPCSI